MAAGQRLERCSWLWGLGWWCTYEPMQGPEAGTSPWCKLILAERWEIVKGSTSSCCGGSMLLPFVGVGQGVRLIDCRQLLLQGSRQCDKGAAVLKTDAVCLATLFDDGSITAGHS